MTKYLVTNFLATLGKVNIHFVSCVWSPADFNFHSFLDLSAFWPLTTVENI